MSAHLRSQARRARVHGAFTLVELLVVVSIIALLISILLPSLKKAREQTRTVKCLANLRSMGMGVQLYIQDQNSVLPGPLHPPIYRNTGGSASGTSGWPAMNVNTERPWFMLYRLAPYFTTQYDSYLEYTDAVATCPTQMTRNDDSNFRPGYTAPGNTAPNPAWSRPYHYLPNSWSNTAPVFYFGWINIGVTWTGYVNGLEPRESPFKLNSQLSPPSSKSYYRPKPIEMVSKSSAEWMIGDAWFDFRRIIITPTNRPTFLLGTWQLGDATGPTGDSRLPILRKPIHAGDKGTNLVYFDAHAETHVGTDNWPQKFPANLRSGLQRPQ